MEFNEAMFKTKVDNIFVKLYTAVMKGSLDEVSHFISRDIYNKYQEYISNLDSKNLRQMYDELNVKNTEILSHDYTEEKEIVKVELTSRYMDYLIDKDTGNLVSGDNTRRVEKRNLLVFEKKSGAQDGGLVRKCPGCGASISVNTSGKCEYCGTIYNLDDYDYILVSIEVN